MNAPNIQATMMSCTRRSRETSMKPRRIAAVAPLSVSVCNRTIAPKMIHSSVTAITAPLRDAAATCMAGTFQNIKANAAVIA